MASILITAFEVDLGASGLGAVAGSLYDATDGDVDAIRAVLLAALAERVAVASPTRGSRTRRVVGVVRRRPRVLDEEALDNVTLNR